MGRAPCCDKTGLKKGPWTPEEDQKLIDYIQKNGHGSWRTLPKNAGLARCGKSCRLRWTNYLRPDIKRGRFSFEEEETIIQLHSILGNKWSAIAARLPGRTDNEIKNYWNTHIRKRLLRMGIDPVTHTPRLDLIDLSSLLNPNSLNNSTLYNNFDISKFLAFDPLLNSELVRIATTLFSSQNQSSNATLNQNHQLVQQQQQMYQLQAPLALQDQHLASLHAQTTPIGLELLPSSSSSTCQLVNNVSYESLGHDDNLVQYANNVGYETLGPRMNDHLIPEMCSQFYNIARNGVHEQNYNLVASVLSTPDSSPTTNLNSCNSGFKSAYSSNEDEKDSYCNEKLFKFQIPDLLDVSDFI